MSFVCVNRARASISYTPGGHLQPLFTRPLTPWTPVLVQVLQTLQMATFSRCFTCSYPMGTRSRASISYTPGGRHRPLLHTHSHPMDTRSGTSTSNTQVAAIGRCFTRPLIPWTPVLVQVLQTLQVAAIGRCCTPLIPWTPVLVQVLQTLQVATFSRC